MLCGGGGAPGVGAPGGDHRRQRRGLGLLDRARLLLGDGGRVEALFRALHLVEVELRRHAGHRLAEAERRVEQALHAALDAVLDGRLDLDAPGRQIARAHRLRARREHPPRGVDHRHARGDEALDARGDEVDDAAHVLVREARARRELQEDRGRRRPLALDEERGLRHHEVHARAGHAAELADRPRQLALQGALVVDPLVEVAEAERALVEDLEAHARAERQALRGDAQPDLVHLVGRHEDLLTGAADAVRRLRRLELGDDGPRVLGGQRGEERHVLASRPSTGSRGRAPRPEDAPGPGAPPAGPGRDRSTPRGRDRRRGRALQPCLI